METASLRQIVEALLLAAHEPLSLQRLAGIATEASSAAVEEAIDALNAEYEASGRAFRIEPVAGGFQIRTLAELAPWIAALRPATRTRWRSRRLRSTAPTSTPRTCSTSARVIGCL